MDRVYVWFSDPRAAGRDLKPRWLRCLPRGWAHCGALLRQSPCCGWLISEALSNGTRVARVAMPRNAPWADQEDAAMILLAGVATAALAVDPEPRRERMLWPGPYTCVEHVKHLLGLSAPLVLTPRQLYRALLRRGARVLPLPKESPPRD